MALMPSNLPIADPIPQQQGLKGREKRAALKTPISPKCKDIRYRNDQPKTTVEHPKTVKTCEDQGQLQAPGTSENKMVLKEGLVLRGKEGSKWLEMMQNNSRLLKSTRRPAAGKEVHLKAKNSIINVIDSGKISKSNKNKADSAQKIGPMDSFLIKRELWSDLGRKCVGGRTATKTDVKSSKSGERLPVSPDSGQDSSQIPMIRPPLQYKCQSDTEFQYQSQYFHD